ncbi:hypothetical protein BJV78DRAFT_1376024 [Lactifluus subvellereus]|nr:hypothetical protein BJV78DRAFT_1376024 [Lactifluus subvellereus]
MTVPSSVPQMALIRAYQQTLRVPWPTDFQRDWTQAEYCPDKYPEIDHGHAVPAGASWADKLSSGPYIQPHVLNIYPLA